MTVPDSLIMQTLGVVPSSPVVSVCACSVQPGYEGEYKDPDKPLVMSEHGQLLAYSSQGLQQWAAFYGPRLPEDKGRVWIERSDFNSHGHHFDVLSERGSLSSVYYGHDQSRSIGTFPYSFYNEYAPESPAADAEAIQAYQGKFLALACEIARLMGDVESVTLNYGFVLVPEQLESAGYTNIRWVKGRPGVREGWDNERVLAERLGVYGTERVLLKSANSLVPWSCIRRVPVAAAPGEMSGDALNALLTF